MHITYAGSIKWLNTYLFSIKVFTKVGKGTYADYEIMFVNGLVMLNAPVPNLDQVSCIPSLKASK